jgi:group I intron endonuclease
MKLTFGCINNNMIIYKLTNTINNKFYIGVTTGNLKRRLRSHFNKTGKYLSSAIKKYGKKNFIIEQIDSAKTNEELDRKEITYIKNLKPHYNLTTGGRTFFHHNNQTKKIISEYQMVAKKGNQYRLGKIHTIETKEKISNSMKGKKNKLGKTGYTLSLETRQKMSVARQGDLNPAKRQDVRAKLRLAALRRYGHKV